jgi:ribosomal protein S21
MATVVKKQVGQTDDQVIAAFRKKVLAEDLITELKKREFYQKPSRIKYEKSKALKRTKRREPR